MNQHIIQNYHDEYVLSPCTIGIIEILNPLIHGNTTHYITPQWFVSFREQDEEHQGMTTLQKINDVREIGLVEKQKYIENNERVLRHPHIRNYEGIVLNSSYLEPKIIQYYVDNEGIECAIDKTVYLRIFQRIVRKRIIDRLENRAGVRLYYSGGQWYRQEVQQSQYRTS